MTLEEALDFIRSIENRCEIARLTYASYGQDKLYLLHTLFEDITEDALYVMEEFCQEKDKL